MNAIKVSPKASAVDSSPRYDVTLRVLSAQQRAQADAIAQDWRRFAYGVGTGIYDKL